MTIVFCDLKVAEVLSFPYGIDCSVDKWYDYSCLIYWSGDMDHHVYDNTLTYREYCEKVSGKFDTNQGRRFTQDEFRQIIGRFTKVIDGPIGYDDGKLVTMSSRVFSDILDIDGEIFYMGFVGSRGYVIRGVF